MKRFIIVCVAVFLVAGMFLYGFYFQGWYIPVSGGSSQVATSVKQEGQTILLDQGEGLQEFEIRGVDLGAGEPGHFATDYAISKETYLRWFQQIKDMGANTIRVYILQNTAFYEAFYEFNQNNPDPLYLIHGVWLTDYVQNSHMDAFDAEYLPQFKSDIRTMIDVIHGNRMTELGVLSGTGFYTKDISQWVIGYILGVEWEGPTVVYTDMEEADRAAYAGEYLSTTAEATPFEAMLAEAGNEAFRYETERYGQQRLVAFSNWPITDPFEYTEDVAFALHKYAQVDVEHIALSDKVVSGTFASYHVYPYYPDFLRYTDADPDYASTTAQADSANGAVDDSVSSDETVGDSASASGAAEGSASTEGQVHEVNTYRDYLAALVEHHAGTPVVISEYGLPASRGMTYIDVNTGRNQGYATEEEQGRAIAQCYEDIMAAGCAGSIIFEWQDEWFKRTWNTIENVDLLHAPYWSDWQTNEQSFGLLSFDPGDERSVCYVDGDDEEWTDADVIGQAEGRSISMKYDAKFLYFMVRGDDVNAETTLYLPIDTTQKSGATECADPAVSFDRAADFLMIIDGTDNSRVLVQERYEAFRASMLLDTELKDPYMSVPDPDSPTFKTIDLCIRYATSVDLLMTSQQFDALSAAGSDIEHGDVYFYQTVETGRLTYGDANPSHDAYNSLADFCYGDGFVEVKIPWQLLNFSNPSSMQIHDDYYEHYGVENMQIDRMYVGVGDGSQTIALFEQPLQGWGEDVAYHERLKESYYIVQQMWAEGVDPQVLYAADDSAEHDDPLVKTFIRIRSTASESIGGAAAEELLGDVFMQQIYRSLGVNDSGGAEAVTGEQAAESASVSERVAASEGEGGQAAPAGVATASGEAS